MYVLMASVFAARQRWIPRNTSDRLPERAWTAGDRETGELKRVDSDACIFTVTPRGHPLRQMAGPAKMIREKENNRNGPSFIKNRGRCQAKNTPKLKYLIYHSFF
jgi:hypothetical protein